MLVPQEVQNLRNVGVVSLTCKLEDFVIVLSLAIFRLVHIFNVNLDFEGLRVVVGVSH